VYFASRRKRVLTQKKLRLLGPGEVYVDSRLDELPAEAEQWIEAQAS